MRISLSIPVIPHLDTTVIVKYCVRHEDMGIIFFTPDNIEHRYLYICRERETSYIVSVGRVSKFELMSLYYF